MQETYYRIAGTLVLVKQEKEEPIPMFSGFTDQNGGIPELTVELYQDSRIFAECYGIEYLKMDASCHYVFLSKASVGVRMTVDREWSCAVIEGCKNSMDGVMELFLTAFYSCISKKKGILLHASMIGFCGESLLFVGDSGVGKTTQAELWKKYKGADILNGDKGILVGGRENCMAWGSPWKGSSTYAENKCLPLKAIVLLEQADKNDIVRLFENEIHACFFRHVFFPLWDEVCTENVMKTLDECLWRIPVYRLSCRPDCAAVELTCQKIWGKDIM